MPRFLAGLFTHDAALIEELVPFMIVLALESHLALGGAHRGAGDTFTGALRALRTGCEKHHVIGITDQSRGSGGTWCR